MCAVESELERLRGDLEGFRALTGAEAAQRGSGVPLRSGNGGTRAALLLSSDMSPVWRAQRRVVLLPSPRNLPCAARWVAAWLEEETLQSESRPWWLQPLYDAMRGDAVRQCHYLPHALMLHSRAAVWRVTLTCCYTTSMVLAHAPLLPTPAVLPLATDGGRFPWESYPVAFDTGAMTIHVLTRKQPHSSSDAPPPYLDVDGFWRALLPAAPSIELRADVPWLAVFSALLLQGGAAIRVRMLHAR